MKFYVDGHGLFYAGDMQVGDREATAEEVATKLLGDTRTAKLAELNAACRATIYAGFTSTALGSLHAYPAGDKDQTNLAASVLDSLMPGLPADWTTPFWCADDAGVWDMRPHTVTQIQQVGIAGKAAIVAAIQKKAELQAKLMAIDLAAPDAAEQLEAIQWPA